jgi:hypothetical protein
MIIVSKQIVPKGYLGITLFPLVFIRREGLKFNKSFINHERIHLRQQLELLVLPFFVWYGLEFLVGYIRYRSWRKAYQTISFEQEAYSNEKNLQYLEKRTFWQFLQYV